MTSHRYEVELRAVKGWGQQGQTGSAKRQPRALVGALSRGAFVQPSASVQPPTSSAPREAPQQVRGWFFPQVILRLIGDIRLTPKKQL